MFSLYAKDLLKYRSCVIKKKHPIYKASVIYKKKFIYNENL